MNTQEKIYSTSIMDTQYGTDSLQNIFFLKINERDGKMGSTARPWCLCKVEECYVLHDI